MDMQHMDHMRNRTEIANILNSGERKRDQKIGLFAVRTNYALSVHLI